MATTHESGAFELLTAGICALAGEDPATLSDDAIAESLVAFERISAQLEAQRARQLQVFDARRAFENDNVWSSVTWLVARCHMSPSAAAARAAVARTLPSLEQTQAAFRDGEIGYQHAAVITQITRDVGVETVQQHEPLLLDGARQYDPTFVRRLGRHLRECADPDGAQEDAAHEHELRSLNVSATLDGVVYIRGRMDPEGGAVVMTALDSLMGPKNDDGTSTVWQRRHDALVELCRRQLDGGELPDRGGQKPHLHLTVPVDKLRGDHTSPLADLMWGGSIPMETARRLACDAVVTTVLVDAEGKPVVIGPDKKIVPPHLRRAIVIRDGGACTGCGRPASWCDAHHVVHLADGGKTVLANLVLLCRSCHVAVHEGGLIIRLRPDGRYRIVGGRRRRRRLRRGPPISTAA